MIYLELFWAFCKIGAVTFGGGYAMISLIQQEVVSRGWCTSAEFADMVAISQMTPGPIALNTATYVGKITAGIPGALTATFGLIFPALCLTSLVIFFLEQVKRSRAAEPFIRGIRSAAVGLIGAAVLFFMENSLVDGELPLYWKSIGKAGSWTDLSILWQGILIFAVIIILKKTINIKPFGAILLSLGLGAALYTFFPL
ncbi:MAG: chromate transporter [Spirochaetales bacterium]|nr:chromate transporter [Spirochaetales bacterium]